MNHTILHSDFFHCYRRKLWKLRILSSGDKGMKIGCIFSPNNLLHVKVASLYKHRSLQTGSPKCFFSLSDTPELNAHWPQDAAYFCRYQRDPNSLNQVIIIFVSPHQNLEQTECGRWKAAILWEPVRRLQPQRSLFLVGSQCVLELPPPWIPLSCWHGKTVRSQSYIRHETVMAWHSEEFHLKGLQKVSGLRYLL